MEPIEKILLELGRLSKQIARLAAIQNKPMLSFKEAAAYLGVTTSTLYKHTSSRTIPHYKPNGKLVCFRKVDLDAWLESNRVSVFE